MDSIGFLITPKGSHRPDLSVMPWAADSGCYSTPYIGDDAYLRWLDSYPRHSCLFAVAPDTVADWSATIRAAARTLPKIRALGYPAAFIAQDGLPSAWVAWDEFDALFMGGTTAYKLSEDAYALVREAKARGKWCHMGRVNSLRRLRAAAMGGYDSVDGTYLAFGPDVNRVRLTGWLDTLARQPFLVADVKKGNDDGVHRCRMGGDYDTARRMLRDAWRRMWLLLQLPGVTGGEGRLGVLDTLARAL